MGFTRWNTQLTAIVVEYDGKAGCRERKEFNKSAQARKFYLQKDKAGSNPKIVAAAR